MQSCDPAPLSAKQRQRLTWEAATERLLDAAHIGAGEWPAALARLYDGLTWPLINVAVGVPASCLAAQMLSALTQPAPWV